LQPFVLSSLIRVRKSTLDVKLALPMILMQANFSPSNTSIFADGMFMSYGLHGKTLRATAQAGKLIKMAWQGIPALDSIL
jgi:hypothetical protein